ncbi:hypothetical protein I553_10413 [Mycobacterium xenopi 4042]|uniref:Uncharacterized protein n=1 Tax=Mycobacterium xenopi 4042 TaxID=1299334 RepID=X7ZIU5_MYCXE|nr:hypothetical protein I553_10413 [Mycobacterium xenopi 4042]
MPKIKERVDSFPHSRLEELPHPAGAPALEPGAPKDRATHRLKLHRQLSQRLAAEGVAWQCQGFPSAVECPGIHRRLGRTPSILPTATIGCRC